MARFAVLGSGGWGTAVALGLARNPAHRVRLWSARPESFAQLAEFRENRRQLPGVPIPPELELTADPAEAAAGADAWVVAVPTTFLRPTLARFAALARPDTAVVSLTKGIEAETFLRPSEMIREILGSERVAVLSGPSHAEEVARGRPYSLVAASDDADLANWVQRAFGSDRLRVYTNGDLIGVELAGALKNVIAVAAGIGDGLELGDNAKAALLTRGLVEMQRFGVAHGADPATFAGLAGVGDLMTTCFSGHGRNRRAGERIGRGESLAAVTSGPQVAEGVNTSRAVRDRARPLRLDAPIMTAVYDVLHGGVPPAEAVAALMARRLKGERPFG